MRGYIVLCLCVASMAAPEGYNYNHGAMVMQQPATGAFGGGFAGIASNTGGGGGGGGGGVYQGAQSMQHSTFGGHQQHQQRQQHHQQQQLNFIVSKHFFIHSAPEDADEDVKEKHITVGVPKKNYNVVFIKSPAKSNKKTAIKISPAQNEEKTVIYVLSQKSDAADIQTEIVEHPTSTAKPEVFFIKYKTNEEAHHAQEQIQAQYDALGGTSHVSDEGVAPVTSVIGSAGGSDGSASASTGFAANVGGYGSQVGGSASYGNAQAASSSVGSIQSGAAQNNAYLPPNFY